MNLLNFKMKISIAVRKGDTNKQVQLYKEVFLRSGSFLKTTTIILVVKKIYKSRIFLLN